jgi:hypothetical protein
MRFRLAIVIILISTLCFAGTQQTSSTLASAIITQVRANINESAAEFWTDDEIIQWINDGIKDIVRKTHCYQTTESINLIANQIEYTVTTSAYLIVKAVHYIDSDSKSHALELSSPNLVGREEDVEEPEYYYDWAGKVGVFPALPAIDGETITLYLVTLPTDITSSDNIPTPHPYDTAIVYYVTARAFAKDRQFAKAGAYERKYEAELDRLKAELVPMSERPVK